MILDLISLGLITAMAVSGWRRGTAITVVAASGLVGGYLMALGLYRPLGRWVTGLFNLPPILAYPLAGMGVMLAVSFALRYGAFRLSVQRARLRDEGWRPPRSDRIGGAAIGTLWGVGLAVVVAWGAIVLTGLSARGPNVEASVSGRLAAAAVGKTVYAIGLRATGDRMLASALSAMAATPRDAIASLNRLFGDARVLTLLQDPGVRASVARADVNAVSTQAAVRALAGDVELLEAAQHMGMVGDVGANPAQRELSRQLIDRMAPTLRAVQQLAGDDEVMRLVRESDVAGRLERGDAAGLVVDPEFNRLAERILDAVRAAGG